MGRGALVLLLSIGSVIMKVLWVTLLVVLILFVQSEAKKKPKGKKPKPTKPQQPKCGEAILKKKDLKKLIQFTVMAPGKGKGKPPQPVTDAPCWWDSSLKNCGRCKPNGVQCGYPMQRWCQSKKSKIGCPGVPSNKYTLSAKGYPCFDDHKSKDCAWCAPGKVQCLRAKSQKCGNVCNKPTSLPCRGVKSNCENIPKCGHGAECDKKTKTCKCEKGYKGNGFQCINTETGELASNPDGNVDVSIESESKFFVFPDGSEEFPTTA